MADKKTLSDDDIKTTWSRSAASGGLHADPDSTDPDGTDTDGTDGDSGDSDTKDS